VQNESTLTERNGEPAEALQTHGTETYRSLVEGIGDVVYAADAQGRLIYVSPAVRGLLGYDPEEVIGWPVAEFTHPDDRPRQSEAFSRLLSGGSTSSEYRLLTRSGEMRWVRTSSQPAVSGGRVTGVRGILTDITDQKLAELQLRQQNEFLGIVLESLSHPFYVISTADYSVKMANSAALRARAGQGAACYALTHGRFGACDGTAHPCPLEMVKRTGKPVTVEHQHSGPDGTPRYVEVYAYPLFDAGGHVAQVIEYTLDVTERRLAEEALRKSERRYRQLLETLQEGIWAIDRHACTTFANPRMAEMLGCTVEEMQGKSLFEFIDEGSIEIARRYLERRAEGIREEHEFEFTRKDGSRLVALLTTSPLLDEARGYQGALAGVLDITERKQADQALRQAAVATERIRLARELHDSVTQALFSASLVTEVLPQVWRRDPDEAEQALDELRELTHCALAEMRALLLELRPSALLESPLDRLLAQLVPAITGRCDLAASLDLEPVPSLPDEVQLAFYRVCQEAVRNAAKHAAAGCLSVVLRASPRAAEPPAGPWQGHLLLQVSDDGHGFDPRSAHGEQMGLRIMRERAESIGARLAVESRPGAGTRVSLEWSSP
jgi:PAS domain S-box-containing protein